MLTNQSASSGLAGIDQGFGGAAGLGRGFACIDNGLAGEEELVGVGRSGQYEGPAEAEAEKNQAKGPGHRDAKEYPFSKMNPGSGLRQRFSRT